jgi:putative hemolysin
MSIVLVQLLIIVILTLANGFFSSSEIAVVSSRRGRLQNRAEAGSRGARIALQLAEEPNRFLATVQVGISLIGTFAAAFGGDALSEPLAATIAPYVGEGYANGIALGLVVLFITYLSLILGELVPKRLALQNAEAVATFVAPIMQTISRIAAPVVWVLTISTQSILFLLGRSKHEEEQVTEEDVMSLVREGTAGGTLEASEQEMIERVFNFTDRTAREIMTPRPEIVAVELNAPMSEVLARITEQGYSRIPVYEESIDHIAGIVYAKDLLLAAQQTAEGGEPTQLKDLVRPPVFVLEHQRIASVLRQFKQTRTHLALVLDEYGQTDGLVTLEDVLEELAGDISDEYDETNTMIIERPDGSFLVDGLMTYGDAQRRIGLPAKDSLSDLPDFDTIAGLVLAVLGRIPSAGQQLTIPGWALEVMDMDGVRIDKVLVRRIEIDGPAQNEAMLALRAMGTTNEEAQRAEGTRKRKAEQGPRTTND